MASSNHIISLRRHDLDNLRSFLTGLVVVHHTAIAYGGSGGWYYKSPLFQDTSPLLVLVNAVDQSFFMALFFWISGRMSAQGLDRSRPAHFLRNKLLRLGLPTLIFTLLVQPMTISMVQAGLDLGLIVRVFTTYWATLRGVQGPVWYTATLLFFDCIAAGIRQLRSARARGATADTKMTWSSHYRTIARWGWLGVAVSSFFIRLVYPVGVSSPYLLDIQPGYMSQYVFAYTLGYMAYIEDEPRLVGPFDPAKRPVTAQGRTNLDVPEEEAETAGPMPPPKSRPGRYLAGALSLSVLTLCLSGVYIKSRRTEGEDRSINESLGGWSIPAVLYAVWNEFGFVTIGPALMACFEKWWNKRATSWVWTARYSYAAFLLHPPVGVAIEILVDKIMIGLFGADKWISVFAWKVFGPLAMSIMMGGLSAAASFVAGGLMVNYVPWVGKVI